MGSSDVDTGNRKIRYLILAASILVLGVAIFSTFRKPQIGDSEEAFKTVDALFTALTTKDLQRLDDCEQRLSEYREAGELNPSAAARLDKIIQQARTGDWENSARRLYDFMLSQRGP